jgi:hypothetical protein
MWSNLHQLHKLCHHFSFKKMMQATAHISFCAVDFIGAAKACSLSKLLNAFRTLRLWLAPCLNGVSSAQLRSTMSGYFT